LDASSKALEPEGAPPTLPSHALRRPANAEEFVRAPDVGNAKLTVENGTTEDAVFMLHNGAEAKGQSTCELDTRRLWKDCAFIVTFESGQDWSDEQRAVTRNVKGTDFLSVLDFTDKRDGDTLQWQNHEITLHKVRNGNTLTRPAQHRPEIPSGVSIDGR
jgi:hypothetical protein